MKCKTQVKIHSIICVSTHLSLPPSKPTACDIMHGRRTAVGPFSALKSGIKHSNCCFLQVALFTLTVDLTAQGTESFFHHLFLPVE